MTAGLGRRFSILLLAFGLLAFGCEKTFKVITQDSPTDATLMPHEITIQGIKDGSSYDEPVSFNVKAHPGEIYSAKIDGEPYQLGTEFLKEGTHTLVVRAIQTESNLSVTKTIKYTISIASPASPTIIGIENGQVYFDAVSITTQPQKNTIFEATLDGNPYTLGQPITGDGDHTLKIVAKKTTTAKTAEKVVKFVLDTQNPAPATIKGVEEGKIYGTGVAIAIDNQTGIQHVAQIDGEPYALGTTFTGNGSHTLTVTSTKLSNGKIQVKTVRFGVDTTPPELNAIDGVIFGQSYSRAVVIDLPTQIGVEYETTIDGEAYIPGTPYSKNGFHTLEVTAKKVTTGVKAKTTVNFNINISIQSLPPDNPKIIGIEADRVYTHPVLIVLEPQANVSYRAQIDGDDFPLGTSFGVPGEHTLLVTATDTKTSQTSSTKIKFILDTALPSDFAIKGITDGGTYLDSVIISIDPQAGVEFGASIDDQPYVLGTPFSIAGSHFLGITATKTSNKFKLTKSAKFNIDNKAPGEPVILGIKDEGFYSTPVTISVVKEGGIDYTATIDGNPFNLGSTFSTNGAHTLVVSAKKVANGLTVTNVYRFTIDTAAPNEPVITGVSEGGAYTGGITITINRQDGVSYSAAIDGIAFSLGTHYAISGQHTLVVTAKKLSTGLTSGTTIHFLIDSVAPSAPIVLGVEDGRTYANGVSITVVAEEGVAHSISIDGKPYTFGSLYNLAGNHTLVATARKLTTGLVATTTLHFTIDPVPPSAPAISGIEEGKVYSSPVTILFAAPAEEIYTATMDGVPFASNTSFGINGAHTFVVTAKKPSGLTTQTIVHFTIDKTPPAAPTVGGVSEGSIYTGSVTITASGGADSYTATMDGAAFALNSSYGVIGTHTLIVTAHKAFNGLTAQTTVHFTIDPQAPASPTITGVSDGGVYGSALTITASGNADRYSATINNVPYTLGSSFNENGSHTLVVTAHKLSNGLTSQTTVHFTLDTAPPGAPIVNGVTEGSAYGSAITATVSGQPGTTYSASIDGAPYALGTSYGENGTHTLIVTATKGLNGKTATTTVHFSIDRTPPAAPEVSGVNEGVTYGSAVTITASQTGSLSASIDGNPYTLGTSYGANGSHTLVVTATKPLNGFTSSTTVHFIIDTLPPPAPVVGGVSEGGIYSDPVLITVSQQSGISYSATMDGASFALGSSFGANGDHTLIVTATKVLTGKASQTVIHFTIDNVPPTAPVIGGVTEGSIYSSAVAISVTQHSGNSYSAAIDDVPYTLGSSYGTNGSHTLVVTARKLSNNLISQTIVHFSVDTVPPVVPVIGGASEDGVYNHAVVITASQPSGVTYSASMDGSPFSLGGSFATNGSHTLIVTATKTNNGLTSQAIVHFTIDTVPPVAPIISGVSEGATYASAVNISVTQQTGNTYTATLDGVPYTLGSSYGSNGTHTLVVTARKLSNDLTSQTTVHFSIDTLAPATPVISGVTEGATYGSTVTITAAQQAGNTYTATIDGTPYVLGNSYSINGNHTLSVTATKTNNGLSSQTVVHFTLDTTPPAAPVVSGVTDGGAYPSAVSITWTQQTGNTYTATIDGAPYTMGSDYGVNGSHTLVVTATKFTTGLTSQTTVHFTIDSLAPLPPDIDGIDGGDTDYGPVTILIDNPEPGVTYTALIDNKPYTLGTSYDVIGSHTLVVTARKTLNNLTSSATFTFTISKKAPPKPTVYINGVLAETQSGTYSGPVTITAVGADGAILSATIDRQSYTLGSGYSTLGRHTARVRATNAISGKKNTKIIHFKIE